MSKSQRLAIKDICRYIADLGRSNRECARALGISPTTIAKYRSLLQIQQINPQIISKLSEAEIRKIVQAERCGGQLKIKEPDWEYLCAEAEKQGVTIALLYQEYVDQFAGHADAGSIISMSTFGRRLRAARKKNRSSMRQTHPPGARMFSDFSGKHLYLTEPGTGKKTAVEIFVASLGASQLIFSTAVPSQQLPDWIDANVKALEFTGGVPLEIVPDNLKSAVTKPVSKGRSAIINRTYLDFAEHYNVAINPARVRRPQDKALAEIAVRMVNMWVIAALRNCTFYTLTDMNREISTLVDRINNKKTRRTKKSRRTFFEEVELPSLQSLPDERYQLVTWQDNVLVPKDYHIPWKKNYYSIPYVYIGRRVSLAASSSGLRFFVEDSASPVAVHRLRQGEGEYVTDLEHMPTNHRGYAEKRPQDLRLWARETGHEIEVLFDAMERNKRIKPHARLNQMMRAQHLARQYGADRLVAACKYANNVGTQTMESVTNILRYDIDLRQNTDAGRIVSAPIPHKNVRGAASYDRVDS